jgi:YesN/AraC family two-component response regulator
MGTFTTKRSVKINIPEFVEEYMAAHSSRDLDGCEELKDHFYKVYSRMSETLKQGTVSFLEKYLTTHRINHKKHLGNVFEELNLELSK